MNISKKNYNAAGFFKKYKKWIIIAGVIIIAVWGYKTFFAVKKIDVPVSSAQKGNFEIKISEVGSIEAESNISIYPKVRGKILNIVKEGTKVKKGDFLFSLDPTDLEDRKKGNELDLSSANTNLDTRKADAYVFDLKTVSEIKKSEADLKLAELKLKDAEKNFEKYERLRKENLVLQTEYDSKKLDLEQKRVDLKKAQYSLDVTKKSAEIDKQNKESYVFNADLQVKIRQQQLDKVLKDIKDTTSLAPSSGVVFIGDQWENGTIEKFRKNSDVYPGDAIVKLPDLSTLIIKLRIPESEIDKIRMKQRVKFNLESETDKFYWGEINEISKFAQSSGSRWDPNILQKKFFEIKVGIKKEDIGFFKPGMTVNSEIFIEEIKGAVYIPIECLFDKDGKKIVYLKSGWGFKEKIVEAGKSNDNFIQITKGLNGGEILALKKPAKKGK